MTDEELREHAVERVTAVRARIVKLLKDGPSQPVCGICYHTDIGIYNLLCLLHRLERPTGNYRMSLIVYTDKILAQWPHFTGLVIWPVPKPLDYDPDNLWVGLQGAYRRSLCIFLLEQIRNAIGD